MIFFLCFAIVFYFILYKLWSSAVKSVGRKILFVVKPVYKFLLKTFSITVVVSTILTIIFTGVAVVGMVKGSDEEKTSEESIEQVEEAEPDVDNSFLESFVNRAAKRSDKFTYFLTEKVEKYNKSIGFDEDGEYKGSTGFLIAYVILLFILMPFIFELLVIVVMIVVMLELLAVTFAIDTVILIIRLVFADNAIEKVKSWWEAAKA